MSWIDTKNQFLVEMYTLDVEFLKKHDELDFPKCSTISKLMIDKILRFEEQYGSFFYESFIGYYFMYLFIEIGKQFIDDLNRELSFSKLKRFLLTVLNRDESYYYWNSCDFIMNLKIPDLKENIIDFICEYMNSQNDLPLEEQYGILNRIRTELALFVDYEFAESVMNEYSHRQKCIKKNTRSIFKTFKI